jgi:hypothetical protein
VIGLAGVLGLAGLVVSRYTDETEADDDRAASDRAEGDDELGGGDDDVRVIDVDAPTGPVVQNSSYTLTLPGGWVGTDMSDGVAGVGAEVFPADPQAAAAVDAVLSLSGISDDAPLIPELLAVDASIADAAQSRFGLMLALGVPAEFGTDTPEEATEEFVQGMLDSPGARGEPSAEVVDLDGRRVGRVVALEGEIGGAGSVSYLFVEELLILNFTVQETTAAQLALLDASAATLSAR